MFTNNLTRISLRLISLFASPPQHRLSKAVGFDEYENRSSQRVSVYWTIRDALGQIAAIKSYDEL